MIQAHIFKVKFPLLFLIHTKKKQKQSSDHGECLCARARRQQGNSKFIKHFILIVVIFTAIQYIIDIR